MMKLEVLQPQFTVYKAKELPKAQWLFVGKTDNEFSVMCETEAVPEGVVREDGWRGLRVQGTMEFSLVGVLAHLTEVLKQAEIPVFALSTFDTDYLFVKAERLEEACGALRRAGDVVYCF